MVRYVWTQVDDITWSMSMAGPNQTMVKLIVHHRRHRGVFGPRVVFQSPMTGISFPHKGIDVGTLEEAKRECVRLALRLSDERRNDLDRETENLRLLYLCLKDAEVALAVEAILRALTPSAIM